MYKTIVYLNNKDDADIIPWLREEDDKEEE